MVLNADQASAQGCLLTIEKAVTPENDTPFPFTIAGNGMLNGNFELRVPTLPSLLFAPEIGTFVTVTEQVPPGWELEGIECVQGTTNCGLGEFLPCLNITIDEATNSVTATCLDDDSGSSLLQMLYPLTTYLRFHNMV